jgi:hypothetical protein
MAYWAIGRFMGIATQHTPREPLLLHHEASLLEFVEL